MEAILFRPQCVSKYYNDDGRTNIPMITVAD